MALNNLFESREGEAVGIVELGTNPPPNNKCTPSNPLTKPAYDEMMEQAKRKGWIDNNEVTLVYLASRAEIFQDQNSGRYYFRVSTRVSKNYVGLN